MGQPEGCGPACWGVGLRPARPPGAWRSRGDHGLAEGSHWTGQASPCFSGKSTKGQRAQTGRWDMLRLEARCLPVLWTGLSR